VYVANISNEVFNLARDSIRGKQLHVVLITTAKGAAIV
jgi:hypothetical protein